MKPLAVFHSADLDGVCSGAIVKHFIPDCEMVGYDYGQPFPWDKIPRQLGEYAGHQRDGDVKRTVFMVDVSLPPADMKRLAEVSDLVWIDHHKTAIEGCAGIHPDITGVRTVGMAACELCWVWFSMDQKDRDFMQSRLGMPSVISPWVTRGVIPEAVHLLGRYDVRDRDNPDWESKIMPFQYGMRTTKGIYDPACEMWGLLCWDDQPEMVRHDIESLIGTGEAILRYQAEVNRRAMEAGAHEVVLEKFCGVWQPPLKPVPNESPLPTLRILACNTIVFNSQFFEGFYDPGKHDVMCAYAKLANGRWKVSLYSTKPEIDCGAIAKTFGGGGHRGAAGFSCDRLPWEAST